jgi:hypothetical protein
MSPIELRYLSIRKIAASDLCPMKTPGTRRLVVRRRAKVTRKLVRDCPPAMLPPLLLNRIVHRRIREGGQTLQGPQPQGRWHGCPPSCQIMFSGDSTSLQGRCRCNAFIFWSGFAASFPNILYITSVHCLLLYLYLNKRSFVLARLTVLDIAYHS